jgi:hypothetical protein
MILQGIWTYNLSFQKRVKFIFLVKPFNPTGDLNPETFIPEESALTSRLLEMVTDLCSKLIFIAKISLDLLE